MSKEEKEQLQEESDAEKKKEDEVAEKPAEEPKEKENKEEAVEEKPKEEEAPAEDKKPEDEKLQEEEKKEEPKKEEAKEEAPAKEEPKEETKEEPAKEDKVEKKVDEEIESTKEELSVVKAVRDELVVQMAENKDLKTSIEKLTKEAEQLKKDKEVIEEKLQRYVNAEEKLAEKRKQERLEKLSAKFTQLGQDKTVEQLSKKDEETLSEFEKIVDAAIEKSGEVTEQPSETVPSNVANKPTETSKEETPKEEVAKQAEPVKPTVMPSNQFFAGVLQKMSKEQMESRKSKVMEI